MQNLKSIRIISLIFGFTLLIFSCTANTEFGITAKAVPEGLLISLKNFPADASHMWINISTIDENEDPESPLSIISSYAAITNTSELDWVNSSLQLEKIKQTGTILFPYVKPGNIYRVSADVYTLQEREQFINDYDYQHQHTSYTEVTVKNGIYFNRDDVKLELNNDLTAVTLSSQPVFSSDVTFADQKYSFGFTLQIDGGSLSVGDHHIPEGLSGDGLTWVFEPQMSSFNLRSGDYLEEGVIYPAWANTYVNILYDDIQWSIEIANTALTEFKL